MSQLTTLSGRFIPNNEQWMALAVFMGIPFQHCDIIYRNDKSIEGNYSSIRCSLRVLSDWLNREEGTGDLPRTRDTVFKALKSFFATVEHYGNGRDEHTAEALQILMED